ncbi:hypothetical protein A7E77_00110 [Sphingomonas sp. NIC1]|nr:hypothetical protein A7E77_00110 [Sphingomonas sp. NIC1]
MQPRIYTSEGDQAYRHAGTAWQRERARGRLQPMVDEHGQPWTALRLACEALLCACALFLPFAVWAVLS